MPTDIGPIHFDIYHSDNSDYGTEWQGLRLNDDYHRLYLIAGGEAEVVYNGIERTLMSGHTYLFPTTTSFRYRCPSKLRLLNICFKMTIDGGIDVLDLHPFAVEVPVMDMAATLDAMTRIDACVGKDGFSHQLALRGQIMTLLSPHFRARETEHDRRRRKDVQRLAGVLRHISEHLRTGVTIADLPAIAGMSRSYFSKKFLATYEMSPQDFIRKQRVELVKRELHTSHLPLSVLAEDFGFSSASHLTREFKHHTGYTPKDFRELDRFYD